MNIQQLAKINKDNGGYFFDKETLKVFGDKLSSFGIEQHAEFPDIVRVFRKKRSGNWYFSKTTGRVLYNFPNSLR
jgi:hypothetical protein